MKGNVETGPTRGPASNSISVGIHTNRHSDSNRAASPSLADLEQATTLAAGLHFRDDLLKAVRLRNQAHDRAVDRQRNDAQTAADRTSTKSITTQETSTTAEMEIEIQQATAALVVK